MTARLKFLCNAVLVSTLAAMNACGDQSPAAPVFVPTRAGVYSEVFDYASVQSSLPELAASQLDLYQAIASTDIGSSDLATLLRTAAQNQVGVRAWLLLPMSDGYWLNEANVDEFATALDQLLAWIASEKLTVSAITFDIEPAWDYTQQFLTIAADTQDSQRDTNLVNLVKTHLDSAHYLASRAKIQTMIDHVHAAGLAAHCVTYPQVLDDAVDDAGFVLQDGLDIPVAGLTWDEVSFMVYRSTFELLAGQKLTTDLIYSYAVDAVAQFGDKAGIDFGVIGDDPVSHAMGYQTPSALAADIGAARAAGISATRLHMYSYEEAAAAPPVDAWLTFSTVAATTAPASDPNVVQVRGLFSLLALLLTRS